MANALRGEALIEGTGESLVFDYAAIDRIEDAADRSIFDLIAEVQAASAANRQPRLSTMTLLLWGAFIASRPAITRDEAAAILMSGDEPTLAALGKAIEKAFAPQSGEGGGSAANPPRPSKKAG